MIDNQIYFEPQRPAMEVKPEYNDATGEYLGQVASYSTLKDGHDDGYQHPELMEADDQEFENHYQDLSQQIAQDEESYSIEDIDKMFDGGIDEPNTEAAQAAWSLELPSADEVPGLDVVQILSTKYLMGELTQDEALDQAFQHGYSAEQLAKAYTVFNKAYSARVYGN